MTTMNSVQTHHSSRVKHQRTLKSSIHCSGIGLHSGKKVHLQLLPAPADTGIIFRRSDLSGPEATIPAKWDNVIDTRLCTVIGNEHNVHIATVEHLMAALSGMGIDNIVITVDAAELPVMDGSSQPFIFLIECAGILEQEAPRRMIEILKPIHVGLGDASAALLPGNQQKFTCDIDFNNKIVGQQSYEMTLVPGAFKSEISRARTFGFKKDVEAMYAAGLALGGSLENAVVFDEDTVMNPDGLRYHNECVRHKLLDAVGDLYLAGAPILGCYKGYRAGHHLNNLLLRELFADSTAWCFVGENTNADVDLAAIA